MIFRRKFFETLEWLEEVMGIRHNGMYAVLVQDCNDRDLKKITVSEIEQKVHQQIGPWRGGMRFRVTRITRDKNGNIVDHNQGEVDAGLLQPQSYGSDTDEGRLVPVESVEIKMIGDNYVALTINYKTAQETENAVPTEPVV